MMAPLSEEFRRAAADPTDRRALGLNSGTTAADKTLDRLVEWGSARVQAAIAIRKNNDAPAIQAYEANKARAVLDLYVVASAFAVFVVTLLTVLMVKIERDLRDIAEKGIGG